ncbi:MAG: carboxypeptidase-like regulatory domain-containing protein [Chitinophagaceae bacterium]|nr:MAG: carboxypeptidase-like regulatory domain-containing protein [Chitinophagaceae bacterium]
MLILIFSWSINIIHAQITIKGVLKDQHSEEVIPFASIQFKNTEFGGISDSAGNFVISFSERPADTLVFSYAGFENYYLDISHFKKDTLIDIYLSRKNYDAVVVKTKINKGLFLWKKIVQHKPYNNRYKRFDNFGYDLYNKLELDLKHLKSVERLTSIGPFKPINKLIKQNIDSSEGPKVLPAYLTETISKYYFQHKPEKRREEIIAVNTNGIENESLVKYLGGMDQVVNIYSNYINIFNKEFVSPASDNGDFYYNYNVIDTQKVGNDIMFHLVFTPRRKGMNTFEGDCWVVAKSFAIQKVNLRLDKSADVNFLDRLSLIQEYTKIDDSTWFINRDKFVADMAPAGKSLPGVIGKKTSTYRNIIYNNNSITNIIAQNLKAEEVIPMPLASNKSRAYWDTVRHEQLTKTEIGIIKMIDTIVNTRTYQRLTKQILTLTTGYFDVGNVEFGSVYNWFSGNAWEGFRMRFDVGSNKHFDRHLRYNGYLAYGFSDKKLKGKAELFYLPKRDPRKYYHLEYKNDLDFGQTYFGEISQDNIFSFAIRKPNIPIKFINQESLYFGFFNEWRSGISILPSISRKNYLPLKNLVIADSFVTNHGKLTSTEIGFRLRFAYLEKFFETTFNRFSLGSQYPILELNIAKGISGFMNSGYNYWKTNFSVSDYINTPPFGTISYQAYAGKIFGKAPYPFLAVAPGNEMYYYNKYAFNMMNRYEFIHDAYAGINYEHNIGNGIFRLVPKLKFRQFYTVKALWGSLSDENKKLNYKQGHNFQSLDGKTYLEVGTGIDNILRVLRIDFIWRLLPERGLKETTDRFGIFGSIRFNL